MNVKGQALKEAHESAYKAAREAWGEFTKAREEASTKGTLGEDSVLTAIMAKKQAYDSKAEESEKARSAYMSFLENGSGGGDNLGTKTRLFGDWPSKLSDSFIEGAGTKAFDVTSGGTATSAFLRSGDPGASSTAAIRPLPESRKPVTNEKFDYLRQTVATFNAAETAAGSARPTSVLSLERVEDRVRTIAHLSEPVDRAFLLDVDNLRDFVDGQLRLGVLLREDSQVISGNGSGENLRGILNTSGILTQVRSTDQHVDCILKGIIKLQAQPNPFAANGLVLNPNDLQTVLLSKDANGNYTASDAGAVRVEDDGTVFIWGLEVISSVGIAQGRASSEISTRRRSTTASRPAWTGSRAASSGRPAPRSPAETSLSPEVRSGWASRYIGPLPSAR
jgi:HK97 family phage major capsid protein